MHYSPEKQWSPSSTEHQRLTPTLCYTNHMYTQTYIMTEHHYKHTIILSSYFSQVRDRQKDLLLFFGFILRCKAYLNVRCVCVWFVYVFCWRCLVTCCSSLSCSFSSMAVMSSPAAASCTRRLFSSSKSAITCTHTHNVIQVSTTCKHNWTADNNKKMKNL